MAQKFAQYKRDVDEFNDSRDLGKHFQFKIFIVTLVSKINMLQFKINSMEELISKHEELELKEMIKAEKKLTEQNTNIIQSQTINDNQTSQVQSIVGQQNALNQNFQKQTTVKIANQFEPVVNNAIQQPQNIENIPAQQQQVVSFSLE